MLDSITLSLEIFPISPLLKTSQFDKQNLHQDQSHTHGFEKMHTPTIFTLFTLLTTCTLTTAHPADTSSSSPALVNRQGGPCPCACAAPAGTATIRCTSSDRQCGCIRWVFFTLNFCSTLL